MSSSSNANNKNASSKKQSRFASSREPVLGAYDCLYKDEKSSIPQIGKFVIHRSFVVFTSTFNANATRRLKQRDFSRVDATSKIRLILYEKEKKKKKVKTAENSTAAAAPPSFQLQFVDNTECFERLVKKWKLEYGKMPKEEKRSDGNAEEGEEEDVNVEEEEDEETDLKDVDLRRVAYKPLKVKNHRRNDSMGGDEDDSNDSEAAFDKFERHAPDDARPDELAVLNGDVVEYGERVETILGPAYFALEDDTPFSIGRKLFALARAEEGRKSALPSHDGAETEKTTNVSYMNNARDLAESFDLETCGNAIVALNERRLPGLRLRSKLHEGTRLWLSPGSPEEKAHVHKTLARFRCGALLAALQKHECALIFSEPVDHVKLGIPDYPEIVKTPMDLGTVKRKLENGEYDEIGPSGFVADAQLAFENCLLYNPRGSEARQMGEIMLKELRIKWVALGF